MASNQKYRIDLEFGADTTEAKKKLQELQQTLTNTLSASNMSKLPLTNEIQDAASEAIKLQGVLKASTTSAGTLDLGQFKSELNKAGMSAQSIADKLLALGPEGAKAFNQLTQSVLSAEMPLKRTNALLENFKTTLLNTAKWQLTSNITHGLQGGLQKAIGFAEDLNESLTNIRIVTGNSVEEMADFAQQANKAAKALSTTTTAYTDASLIFYQQGLNGEDVTNRADTVLKLANVTGESAEEVSSYMTAIWNNFYDGSESLEHYADVITALGAATASSSEEISEGLEKFASIAKTTGLSYEYATAALATVTAQTRQSADTVGTAYKTLFARIQDLEQGNTLDDGVTLGTYSQALENIGVNVLDAKGQVRDMNDILDDMGAKWQTIDESTKIATAQAVAGTRQYSYLMALLENYDQFQANVGVANNAEGTLQEQADIYAESWEAAQKRVKAATEGLYQDLIDDKALIKLEDFLANVIESIDHIVKSIGGLKTLLPTVVSLLLKTFSSSIGAGIDNKIFNFTNTGKLGQINQQKTQQEFVSALYNKDWETASDSEKVQATGLTKIYQLNQQITAQKEKRLKLGLEEDATLNSIWEAQRNSLSTSFEELQNIQKKKEETKITREETEKLLELNKQNNDVEAKQKEIVEKKAQLTEAEETAKKASNKLRGAKSAVTKREKNITDINQQITDLKEDFDPSLKGILQRQLQQKFSHETEDEDEQKLAKLYEKKEQKEKELEEAQQKVTEKTEAEAEAEEKVRQLKEDILRLEKEQQEMQGNRIDGNIINSDKMGIINQFKERYFQNAQNGDTESAKIAQEDLKNLITAYDELSGELGLTTKEQEAFNNQLNILANANPETEQEKINNAYEELSQIINNNIIGFKKLQEAIDRLQNKKNNGKLSAQEQEELALYKQILSKKKQGIQLTEDEAEIVAHMNGVLQANAKDNAKIVVSQQTIGQKVGTTLNAVSSLSMALQGIQGITSTITDDSASLLEKFTAIGIQIPFISSGLINSVKSFNNLIQSVQAYNGALQITRFINKESLTTQDKESAKRAVNIALANKELDIEDAQVALQAIETDEINNEVLARFTALRSEQGIIEAIKTSLNGIGTVLKGIFTSAIGITAAVVAAGAAIAYVVLKVEQNKIAEKAEEANIALNKQYKTLEKIGEKTESLKSLSDAYDDLIESQNDYSPEELKSEVYNLCIQYGEESLAIQALSGDYDALKNSIKGVRKANAEELKQSANATLDSVKIAAGNNINSEIRGLLGNGYNESTDSIDLWGNSTAETLISYVSPGLGNFVHNFTDSADSNEQNFINAVKERFENINIGNNGELNTSELINSIHTQEDFTDWQKIAEEYSDYIGDGLSEALNLIQEKGYLDKIISATEQQQTATLYSISDDDIKSVNDYVDVLSNAITSLTELGLDEDDARTQAKQYMAALSDEFSNYDKSETLAHQVLGDDAVEENVKTLASKIGKMTDEEFSFYSGHTSLLSLYIKLNDNDIDAAVNEVNSQFSELQDYISDAADFDSQYQTLISDSDDVSTTDKILALAGLGDRETLEKSREEAEKEVSGQLDELNKKLEDKIYDFYNISDETKQFYNIDVLKEEFEQEKEELLNSFTDYEAKDFGDTNKIQTNHEWISQLMNDLGIESLTSEIVEHLFSDENLSDKEQQLKITLSETNEDLAKYLESDVETTINDISNLNSILLNDLSDIGDATTLTAKQWKNAGEGLVSSLSEDIDTLQSSYTTLTSAVEEYNKTGKFSLDTLQSLLQLSPEYLASLDVQNGKLMLNKESYIELAKAQAKQMVYSKFMTIYAAAESAALNGNIVEDTKAIIATYGLSEANLDLIATTQTTTLEIINEQLALEEYGSAAYNSLIALRDLVTSYDSDLANTLANSADSITYSDLLGETETSTESLRYYDEEFDRYHDINQAIEDLTEALEELDEEQEHLAGGEYLDSLEYENELLETQKSYYEDLKDAKNTHLSAAISKVNSYGAPSIGVDANGNLTGYAASTEWAIKNLDDDTFEEYKKWLQEVEDTVDEIQDTDDKIRESYYKMIENNFTAFETEVTLNLNIDEAQRDINEFFETIDEDFKAVYKDTEDWLKMIQRGTSTGESWGSTLQTDLQAYNDILSIVNDDNYDYNSDSSKFGSKSEALEELINYDNKLLTDAKSFRQAESDMWSDYLDSIEEYTKQFEDAIGDFERIDKELSHYSKIIDLVYGSDSTTGMEMMNSIYQNQEASNASQITYWKQYTDEQYKLYQEALKDSGGELTEDVQKFKDNYEKGSDKIYSLVEDGMSTIEKDLENKNNIAEDSAYQSIFGTSKKNYENQLNWANEGNDGYYDSVNRVYQLQTLSNKYNKAAENLSLKNQAKLKEFAESQLKILKERDKLSKREVDYAEKLLAVKEAEYALEESKENKNSMKLSRDSSGNWTYQYVADTSDVEDKEQAVLDAKATAQSTAAENLTKTFEDISKLTNLAATAAAAVGTVEDYNSQEEYEAAVEAAKQPYEERAAALADEAKYWMTESETSTIDLLMSMYDENNENYSLMTEAQKALLKDLQDSSINSYDAIRNYAENATEEQKTKVEQACADTSTAFSDIAKNAFTFLADPDSEESLKSIIDGLFTDINTNEVNAQTQLSNLATTAGEDLEGIKKKISGGEEDEDSIASAIEDASDKMDTFLKTTDTDIFKKYRSAISGLESIWDSVKDAIEDAADELPGYNEQLKDLQKTYEAVAKAAKEASDITVDGVQSGGGGGGDEETPTEEANWTVKCSALNFSNGNMTKPNAQKCAEQVKSGLQNNGYTNIKSSTDEKNHIITVTGEKVKTTITNPLLEAGKAWNKRDGLVAADTGTIVDGYIGNSNDQYSAVKKSSLLTTNHSAYKVNRIVGVKNKKRVTSLKTQDSIDVPYVSNEDDDTIIDKAIKLKGGAFASGGYTGEWNGGDGRLAILHSKELVLNASDTENMLAAVKVMRNFTASIGSTLTQKMVALSKLNSGTSIPTTTNNTSNSRNTFEITMNVDGGDVAEIQQAILELPNLASQYLTQK